MKKLFVGILLFSSAGVFAQTVKQMKGSDYNAMMPKVTDTRVFDREGNVLDSVEVRKKVKAFDYLVAMAIPKGQTEYKHVLIKIDHTSEAASDADSRIRFRPKSLKLQEGVTLDLSPLAKRTDLSKLEGKAVVLIFRASQYGNMYGPTNDVIADYIGSNKFEVFAITHLDYNAAIEASKKAPILNAHNIIDAQSIVDFYGTQNDAVIVVTNAQHQITFAITGQAGMTPRTLNKLLKEL